MVESVSVEIATGKAVAVITGSEMLLVIPTLAGLASAEQSVDTSEASEEMRGEEVAEAAETLVAAVIFEAVVRSVEMGEEERMAAVVESDAVTRVAWNLEVVTIRESAARIKLEREAQIWRTLKNRKKIYAF